MYTLTWNITIGNYKIQTLKSVKITSSVLNLSDTAIIEMPGQYINTWQKIEDKIKVGNTVSIELGYDGNNEIEFTGYLKRISRDNNALTLECEDALYLLYKTVSDKEYKTVTVQSLIMDMLNQIDEKFVLKCDYEFTYDKFVCFHTTALDVLKKVQEETKANIWFDNKTLYVRPVYAENASKEAIIFDTRINVQSNNLKWISKDDKKIEIEVKYTDAKGTIHSDTYGTKGGIKERVYVRAVSDDSLKAAAESEYNLWNYDGFEGDITTWLVPRVQAGDSIKLRDVDRAEGKYYVTGVEIEFGQSGAKRKITLGRKLLR